MAEITYRRGEFQAFRATTTFHLGAIESDLTEGEVVLFDGQTMKRGGAEVPLSSLRAAIKANWLVPDEQEGGVGYRPMPADIRIHDAQSTGMDRGEGRRIHTVQDEEVNLGHLSAVRPSNAPEVHVASNAGEVSRGAPTGVRMADRLTSSPTTATTSHGQEGKVLGRRFKTSTQNDKIEIGKDDKRIVQQLDNLSAPPLRASGDVQQAMTGDDLDEVLPEAASSQRPRPGVAGEGTGETAQERAQRLAAERRAQALAASRNAGGDAPTAPVSITPGSTGIGGADDGEVIATVSGGSSEPEDNVPPAAIIQAKIEAIRSFVPGFNWNMEEHWRTRVKKAVDLRDNMPVLNAVLSIETDTVKKHVMQAIYG
jgi:hypothetical protein